MCLPQNYTIQRNANVYDQKSIEINLTIGTELKIECISLAENNLLENRNWQINCNKNIQKHLHFIVGTWELERFER